MIQVTVSFNAMKCDMNATLLIPQGGINTLDSFKTAVRKALSKSFSTEVVKGLLPEDRELKIMTLQGEQISSDPQLQSAILANAVFCCEKMSLS